MNDSTPTETARDQVGKPRRAAKQDQKGMAKRLRGRSRTSLFASGEPLLWLTGGALAICFVMVLGLLSLVLWRGLTTFWPQELVLVEAYDGPYMGEFTRYDSYKPSANVLAGLPENVQQIAREQLEVTDGWAQRRLVRTGNFRITQTHFHWVSDYEIEEITTPEWSTLMERLEWGRFYGFPEAFAEIDFIETDGVPIGDVRAEARRLAAEIGAGAKLVVGDRRGANLVELSEIESRSNILGVARVTTGAEKAWELFEEHHDDVRERWKERRDLEKYDTGEVNHRQEQARLEVREIELELAEAEEGSAAAQKLQTRLEKAQAEYEEVSEWANEEFARIRAEIDAINAQNAGYQIVMRTAGEGSKEPATVLVQLADVVRAFQPNQIGSGQKTGIFLSRWVEFLTDEPREANSEGGVFPAIFGTVAMTLIMSLAVVPFGVLAALYLREYAKAGPVVSAVRIAVNNLAGVPSIVFGVFGLGFFCYVVGGGIDEVFFAAHLPSPTYGTGGLLWASLTLALLTLPVVIVATEEAVSAVPNSMREGSYACGASKWQTIQRIVLPRALPGIITGMILAIARGAGEVAPLMLVGAVKLAPELPVDSLFPYIHPERSFMHLGFHIYDVGFQSQNSEAAKPMVYTTTLLLIVIIALLNLAAIWLRSQLRKKFAAGKF